MELAREILGAVLCIAGAAVAGAAVGALVARFFLHDWEGEVRRAYWRGFGHGRDAELNEREGGLS